MTRQILPLIVTAVVFLTACGSNKFQATVPEDKPLFAAINKLNKKPNNAKAQNDIFVLYQNTVARHENAIAVYRNSANENRWDKLITEYNALQNIYNTVQSVPGASALVQPKNYLQQLVAVKEEAADFFYEKGQTLLTYEDRESDLQAHEAFKRANYFVHGYKDVQLKMNEAYELGTVNVVINPVEDDNIFFASYSGIDIRYRPQDMQEALVRDLGGRNAKVVPARFYTDRDARRENITPDWVVDIRWRNIDVSPTIPSRFSRQVSREIQIGKDTSGKAIYKTVHATLHITQRTVNVRGALDYSVSDLVNNKYVDQGLINDFVSWTESYATYSGDSRALSQNDWALVNSNQNFYRPGRYDVLNTLMRKMQPDLRWRIRQSAS